MAKHPGDSGDWNLDSASSKPMTIRERINTQLGVTSPEVIREMEKEEAFLASVKPLNEKRFTDRRPIPGRDRLVP
jgi:hypothetical protein